MLASTLTTDERSIYYKVYANNIHLAKSMPNERLRLLTLSDLEIGDPVLNFLWGPLMKEKYQSRRSKKKTHKSIVLLGYRRFSLKIDIILRLQIEKITYVIKIINY